MSGFVVPPISLGVLVDNFFVSLWYFDRMGAIVAEQFEFTKSPWKLALIVYALARCSPAQVGFDPFICKSQNPTSSQWPTLDRTLETVIGAELIIPRNAKQPSMDDPRYTITGEALYTYRGVIGRGTTVYPVTSVQDPSQELAAKLSWPIVIRTSEYEHITTLRSLIPWMKEHLPEIIDFAEYSIEELGLPRSKLTPLDQPSRHEKRQFTIMVVPRYNVLWEIATVAEFQDIFVDYLECHYHAYRWGHVLHRDLSEGNLMWKYSSDNKAIGLLIDWDLSSKLSQGCVSLPVSQCRTGKAPFMAVELLDDDTNPPSHLYRHDLESFLYILIWAMVHYNPGCSDKDLPSRSLKTNPVLEQWESTSYEDIIQPKDSLFSNPSTQRKLFAEHQPIFKPLIDTWLRPLMKLFVTALNYRSENETLGSAGYDDGETSGGNLTFEKFMGAIGRVPRPIPENFELKYT